MLVVECGGSEWRRIRITQGCECVGTRNNNKRKESTRIREVCSSCHFFLAKQRYFYLARRVSKFSNTKIN